MQLSKTWQIFAVRDLSASCRIYGRSGMMHNGIVYRLPPWAHLTDGIESGLLPTPACIGKAGLSCREKTSQSISGNNRKDVFGYKISGLQGNYQFKEVRRVSCKEIRTYRNTKGFAQWGIEPETIPRLTEERLNPDWVEWLMGFPYGWTEGGSRMQRLQSLGNAVVPLIPEFLGKVILN